MQQGNAYKKPSVVVSAILLILGLTMIFLSVFNIFAPGPDDYRWIWTILGILFMIDSVYQFFRIKKHKRDMQHTK